MTYLGVSLLLFLAPFLLGVALVGAVVAAGALSGSIGRQGRVRASRAGAELGRVAAPAPFSEQPGFQIVGYSFRHR